MATGTISGVIDTRTVTIDTDLSGKAYHFVNMDTTDDNVVNLATDATGVMYILRDDGDGSSSAIEWSIVVSGCYKVKTGGVVTAWAKLTATTGWVAIATTTDTDNYGAIALENGASGDIIECQVVPGMVAG